MQAWCTSYKTCWCCPQFCTVLRWSLSSACCGINALPMHLIKTLVIFIWLNVSLGGLESLLSLSAINQSISITAAEKRRCIPVYLHYPRPVPQCPTIITISSSPAAIRFRWRVKGVDIALPAAAGDTINSNVDNKKIGCRCLADFWLLLRPPIRHHVRWSPSNLKLSIMKHERGRDIMT